MINMSVVTNPPYLEKDTTDHRIAVSEIDQEFLARFANTLQDIQLTKTKTKSGEEMTRPASRYGSSRKVQTAMEEMKRNYVQKEERKEKVLLEKEKDLWENENWRKRMKDLNSSFSKLTPIDEGKKIIAGKGQAFVVDLDSLEDF